MIILICPKMTISSSIQTVPFDVFYVEAVFVQLPNTYIWSQHDMYVNTL